MPDSKTYSSNLLKLQLPKFSRTAIKKTPRPLKYIQSYKGKEVLVALGQGAALHYINKKNGVKDFDVWFFYPRFGRQL